MGRKSLERLDCLQGQYDGRRPVTERQHGYGVMNIPHGVHAALSTASELIRQSFLAMYDSRRHDLGIEFQQAQANELDTLFFFSSRLDSTMVLHIALGATRCRRQPRRKAASHRS